MGVSIRHYLFPIEGDPQRLSKRLVEGLIFGKDAIPEYAGTRQRVMAVVLHSEDGEPEQMVRTDCSIWVFDGDGNITAGLQDALAEGMRSWAVPPSSDKSVVPIHPHLSRKRLAARYRWQPEQAQIDRIAADIWPEGQHRPLKSAKGIAPKRPPLTWQGERALNEATEPFWKIGHAIERLKEPSLKGFIFEARNRIELERENASLYRALAEMAEQRLEILKRRRSGKGIWYAYIDITRWSDETGEIIASYHERCNGRAAAVDAARKLLAKHADKFSADTTVEAEIATDLEWVEMDKLSHGPSV